MIFMFFICKLMFLTSMIQTNDSRANAANIYQEWPIYEYMNI